LADLMSADSETLGFWTGGLVYTFELLDVVLLVGWPT